MPRNEADEVLQTVFADERCISASLQCRRYAYCVEGDHGVVEGVQDTSHEPPRAWLLPKIPRDAWSPIESELADRAAVYFEQPGCSKAAEPSILVRTKAIKLPKFFCLFL